MPKQLKTDCPACWGDGHTTEGDVSTDCDRCLDGQVPLLVSVVLEPGEDAMVFATREAAVDHVREIDLQKAMRPLDESSLRKYLSDSDWPMAEATREDGEPIVIEECQVLG